MKSLLAVSIVFLLDTSAVASDLVQVKDRGLVHILTSAEVIAESRKPPISVRVVKVRDPGECDGRPQTCPKEVLYIAVSTFDEAPDENVFVLPKSFGWQFIGWKSLPKKEGRVHYVVLELDEKIVSAQPEKTWWSERHYEIGVNPWNGYIKERQQK